MATAAPKPPATVEIRTIVGHVYTGGSAAPWPRGSVIALPAADARALVAAGHAELAAAPEAAPAPTAPDHAAPDHAEPAHAEPPPAGPEPAH